MTAFKILLRSARRWAVTKAWDCFFFLPYTASRSAKAQRHKGTQQHTRIPTPKVPQFEFSTNHPSRTKPPILALHFPKDSPVFILPCLSQLPAWSPSICPYARAPVSFHFSGTSMLSPCFSLPPIRDAPPSSPNTQHRHLPRVHIPQHHNTGHCSTSHVVNCIAAVPRCIMLPYLVIAANMLPPTGLSLRSVPSGRRGLTHRHVY